eukprot:740135-Hanusia_phi.AAC.2
MQPGGDEVLLRGRGDASHRSRSSRLSQVVEGEAKVEASSSGSHSQTCSASKLTRRLSRPGVWSHRHAQTLHQLFALLIVKECWILKFLSGSSSTRTTNPPMKEQIKERSTLAEIRVFQSSL